MKAARWRTLNVLAGVVLALLGSCDGGGTGSNPTGTLDTTGTAARADSIRQAAIADSLRDGYHVYKDDGERPLMEGLMEGGKRHGVWTSYLPSGRVQSRNVYEHGILEGITTVFHPNGVLYYSGMQRQGKPFGEWKFYDREGNMLKTAVYDASGVLIPEKGKHK